MNGFAATTAVFAILVACSPALTGQRSEVDLKWQKSRVIVSFNPVKFGKHALSELPVGREWRMGMNTASTLSTDLPLVGASGLVAPGSYRVGIRRAGERELGLQVASTRLATGGTDAWFPSELEDAKETEELELEWRKGSTKKDAAAAKKEPNANEKATRAAKSAAADPIDGKHAQRATLRLLFGPYRLDMPITMVGARPAKVRGFGGDAFEWPAALFRDQVDKGHQVPVLTLRANGGSKTRPKTFNLLVNDKKAAFYPAMAAPTEGFGFAGVKGFDADDILGGTIEWSDSQREVPFLVASGIEVKDRQLKLSVAVGKRVANITVPMPPEK